MVSLRRRRLLGLCCGARSSCLASLPKLFDGGNASKNAVRSSNPFSVHPVLMEDVKLSTEVNDPLSSQSTSSKEQNNQLTTEQELKRRKQHRRRHVNDQDQCAIRGVYFKNMKWQAAIKVDKKQVHLGTVSSQEEAAHLYDRAAFMCGREPNFELSEEEKQELRNFKWDEFLAMTRRAITTKKTRRRQGKRTAAAPASAESSDRELGQGTEGFSASDDVEADTSTSDQLFLESGFNYFPS